MISVVIPSYNSEQTIRGCLDSLIGQTSAEDVEIILVDSSADRTAELVKEAYPGVRLIRLPRRTDPGTARNLGIDAATGEVLAFIDADCRAEPGWLAGLADAQRAGHRIVGGAIDCDNPLRDRIGWAGYLAEFREFIPQRPRRFVAHLPTANIAYHRTVFDEFGRFDGRFYPQEDLVFNQALQRQGQRILFDPTIRVRHRHRSTLAGFLGHQHRIGRATASVLRDRGGAGACIAFLALPALPLVKFFRTLTVFIRYRRAAALRPLLAWPLLALGLCWWGGGGSPPCPGPPTGTAGQKNAVASRSP